MWGTWSLFSGVVVKSAFSQGIIVYIKVISVNITGAQMVVIMGRLLECITVSIWNNLSLNNRDIWKYDCDTMHKLHFGKR
jgi:hypothetical protein